jgi:hypothetical protein
MGKGSAIWEPLGFMSGLFDREGNVADGIRLYDELHARYVEGANR